MANGVQSWEGEMFIAGPDGKGCDADAVRRVIWRSHGGGRLAGGVEQALCRCSAGSFIGVLTPLLPMLP